MHHEYVEQYKSQKWRSSELLKHEYTRKKNKYIHMYNVKSKEASSTSQWNPISRADEELRRQYRVEANRVNCRENRAFKCNLVHVEVDAQENRWLFGAVD